MSMLGDAYLFLFRLCAYSTKYLLISVHGSFYYSFSATVNLQQMSFPICFFVGRRARQKRKR
jgi:hypothetical protein